MDLAEIMTHLSIPRPNHSQALTETATYIKTTLADWGVPFVVQEFALRPYMQLILGIAVLALAVLLLVLIIKKRPAAALVVALAIPLLLIVEFELFVPVVTGIVKTPGENIVVTYTVPNPARELIFAAHYDSKTDFWDHIQRAKIYRFIPLAFALGVILAIFTFFTRRYDLLRKKGPAAVTVALAGVLVVFWGLVFLGFGGYIFIPSDRQSFGAVDDGGSVAALMVLAKNIHDGKVSLGNSNVTIIFTAGEEVTMQGAHRYVKERFGDGKTPAIPTTLVNLELVAQNGPMVYWKKDGIFVKYFDADPELVERLGAAWTRVSGTSIEPRESIADDAQRFMSAGIPAVTIGNAGTPGLGEGGFHSPKDNIDRVNIDNLALMIQALGLYIEGYLTK
jgi:acetylornithine deacetylase/succinyl-diaminopimelate desuccinylase-like protein